VKRIVVVGMVDSIHLYRWLSQFNLVDFKFILFPSTPHRRIHPGIKALVKESELTGNQILIKQFGGKLAIPFWILDKFFKNRIRGFLLKRILLKDQPDYLHALEFQNAGYISSVALSDGVIKTPLIVTNYGSDIYWFSRLPKHTEKIKKLLGRADKYAAECERDYELARQFGFRGEELPVIPNAGGIELILARSNLASQRKKIIIKGYHGWAGRSLIALKALTIISQNLIDYEIVVYSANFRVRTTARFIAIRHGIKIKCYRKKKLSHHEMLKLFQESRIYVGLSVTDGISTSLLEAMATGAFPIQTATSCANEWVTDGISALLVDDITAIEVSEKLIRSLSDDSLVNRSQEVNLKTISNNANYDLIKSKAQEFYR
jgi:glycosyltransferase involved in cell wall biosynthesis